MPSALKTIDQKGRVTVGRAFAGRLVEVDAGEDEIVLRFKRTVPQREAWLWESPEAKASLERGLRQARDGTLSEGPDLDGAFAFAESLPDGP